MYPNRRQSNRYHFSLPIQISFGEQVVIKGKIINISEKSAFINIGNSVYVAQDDKFKFQITLPNRNPAVNVTGEARVSRIAPGEGIAIYFTEMDEESAQNLKEVIASLGRGPSQY